MKHTKVGLESLIGKQVILMCANYFYTGTLKSVNKTCVELSNPAIVYETGEWSLGKFKDEQSLHVDRFYISISAIEAFGIGK